MQEKNTAHRVFYHNNSMALWLAETEAPILLWCRQGRNAREGVVPHLAFTPGPGSAADAPGGHRGLYHDRGGCREYK